MLGPLRLSLMVTHLDTLIRLAVPGGTSLLTCDLVSSSHYPLDQLAPDANLQAVMDDVVKRGAFYFAANPILIRQLLRRDPALRGQADDPRLLEPWLWTGPHSRTYLVYALRATRR
jgi:hypothetical protein